MSAPVLPMLVQWLAALGPTLVSVAVGGLGIYIAYRQWRTAKDKLTLDLFDKRYAVYLDAFGNHAWHSEKSDNPGAVQADLLFRTQVLFGLRARELMMKMFTAQGTLETTNKLLRRSPEDEAQAQEAGAMVAYATEELLMMMLHELEVPQRGGRPDRDAVRHQSRS